ncbi:MAG TPA: type I-E CRISPR-associated protein Cse2/CasB [Eoetvoesiella sp.]|uniref:type I-E CRISPR-associated protein Cse2/CasB n=1 Tax=Eoetvoesiella sp. TaxID=1966355 RepID=UPI002BA7EE61|nr:type I-E CRISPR-associated protein Cse2/CasB [Eoetvoesiella sp.]HWK60818.1 type I-E CRISPR-associated protein Cse2/CasB [Eoetvoesiella sp.]
MSEHSEQFVRHLTVLRDRDRGALAVLRHSLAFEPGTYPRAFPYVERFAGAASYERDARRLALYAVAALYARHPQQHERSLSAAFGLLARKREASAGKDYSASIENRFLALLGADAGNIFSYLRLVISLLAADDIGLNYAALLDALSQWMRPDADIDRLRQSWARDFYRAALTEVPSDTDIITGQANDL